MEEGLNCNTAPRRRVQWLDSNYRGSNHGGGSQEFFTIVMMPPKCMGEGEEHVRRLGTGRTSTCITLACQVLQPIGKVPTALKAESTILSMEFSYFCLASPSWDDLKGLMEKYVLLLHWRIGNMPAAREPVNP